MYVLILPLYMLIVSPANEPHMRFFVFSDVTATVGGGGGVQYKLPTCHSLPGKEQ